MLYWKIKDRISVASGGDFSFHPVTTQLLLQRGITTKESADYFFDPDYGRDILDPFLFSQMEKVIARIDEARGKKELVAVFGDYDADGVTSSVILEEALNELGIKTVVYIPDKHLEGYGMNLSAVQELKNQGVSLIITVDCGTSNVAEVDLANELGMDVIIVDHHYVQEQVPKALALINPHQKNAGYPFAPLAGVGVVFKVVQAIYQKLLPEKTEQLKWLLDLVAIGTVADCVPLLGENRTIVKYGLIVLSKTRRIGMQEMFAVGRIAIDENAVPDTRKISFQIAPRINAAGRMDHANTAFNLVRGTDRVKGRDLALEIEASNQERQKVTARVVDEVKILAENSFKDKKFIFAVSEHFPVGIVGLVAGKIADTYHKPTAVLQKGETESKGSFRSIPQINIIEAIESCSHLLKRFGGHPQAAGITIANENLEAFYEALLKIISEKLGDEPVEQELEIDIEIAPKDVDFKLVEELNKFEPFGEGNKEPIFVMRKMMVDSLQLVGNGSKHLKLFLRATDGTPKIFESIGFGIAEKFSEIKKGDIVDVAFNLSEDSWNGNRKIQLILVDLKINKIDLFK